MYSTLHNVCLSMCTPLQYSTLCTVHSTTVCLSMCTPLKCTYSFCTVHTLLNSVCASHRTTGGLQCSCHSDQLTSDRTADITLYRNRSHLQFVQSVEGSVANSVFEDLLSNHTRFHHGTLRPSAASSYTTTITIEVSDGSFTSAPSTTTVNIQVNNHKPIVLLDGQVSLSVICVTLLVIVYFLTFVFLLLFTSSCCLLFTP